MAGVGSAAVTRVARSPMTGKSGSGHRSAKRNDGSQPVPDHLFDQADDRSWPVADLHGQGLAGNSRCKPVHLTVALGAQKDQSGIFRKVATSVTQNRKSSNFSDALIASAVT